MHAYELGEDPDEIVNFISKTVSTERLGQVDLVCRGLQSRNDITPF